MFSCCTMMLESNSDLSKILINEQIFLDEILFIYHNLIIPFQKKKEAVGESNIFEILCQSYYDFLSIVTLFIENLKDCCDKKIQISDVVVVNNTNEFIKIYKNYLNVICGIISTNGFIKISKLIIVHLVFKKMYEEKFSDKKDVTNEAIISFALQHPLLHLNK